MTPTDQPTTCPTCGCPDPLHLNHGRSAAQGPCPDDFHSPVPAGRVETDDRKGPINLHARAVVEREADRLARSHKHAGRDVAFDRALNAYGREIRAKALRAVRDNIDDLEIGITR